MSRGPRWIEALSRGARDSCDLVLPLVPDAAPGERRGGVSIDITAPLRMSATKSTTRAARRHDHALVGRKNVNCVVVGAGIVGLAATFEASGHGEVLCLEAGERPALVSSSGECRLFRHRHSDPLLAELAARSAGEWAAWGEELGQELVGREGHVFITPDLEDEVAVLREVGVDARVLGPEEAREICPILDVDRPVGFDPEAGSIRAATTVSALVDRLGDSVRTGSRVEHLRALPGGGFAVRLEDSDVIICERLVIAAGDATGGLASQLRLRLPETETSWHVRPLFDLFTDTVPAAFSDRREVGAYLLPVPGTGKVGIGLAGDRGSVPGPTPPGPEDLRRAYARLEEYIRANLKDVSPTPSSYLPCRSVSLPSSRVGSDGIAVAAAGGAVAIAGGNMFKFAPFLGRILHEATLDPTSVPEALAAD